MQLGGIPLGTNGVNTAAPAGNQHGLAALHRTEQAGELGLGFSHFEASLGIIIYWPMPGLLANASENGHLSCR
jgi:hypothetical protein